jgi:hypothetical protein
MATRFERFCGSHHRGCLEIFAPLRYCAANSANPSTFTTDVLRCANSKLPYRLPYLLLWFRSGLPGRILLQTRLAQASQQPADGCVLSRDLPPRRLTQGPNHTPNTTEQSTWSSSASWTGQASNLHLRGEMRQAPLCSLTPSAPSIDPSAGSLVHICHSLQARSKKPMSVMIP